MKKWLIAAICFITLCIFVFTLGFSIGSTHPQEKPGHYYAIEGHCVSYDNGKNRVEFETPKGIRYYAYGDFEYTLDNLDFLLVMWDNNSEYLLDDYIINYTPISIPIVTD